MSKIEKRITIRNLLCLLALIVPIISFSLTSTAGASQKPRLAYLLSNTENLQKLQTDLNLTDSQKDAIESIVKEEAGGLRELDKDANAIVGAESQSLTEKRNQINAMGFNGQVETLESEALTQIKYHLQNQTAEFDKWIDEQWAKEVAEHGLAAFKASSSSLSYRVFATQYHPNPPSTYEVALPDKYIKFANLGWEHRSGYERNDYTVDLSFSGKSVSRVKILDVGPWNQDDNYWNGAGAQPRPRRLFADLPQGMPESQAAFFNDYNGGKDQFGRTVLNPAGIDLAPNVASDLGIGYLQNQWIDVSYDRAAGIQDLVTTVITPFLSTDISKSTKFKVKWSATAMNSPISSYDVQYKIAGGSWKNWRMNTTARSANFVGRAGRVYYFRARARNQAGKLGQYSRAKRTIVPYDGNKLILRKTGFTNTLRNPSSRFYQNSIRYSTRAGEQIVYQFVGKRLYLVSTKAQRRSKAKIFVDAHYIKTIDTYSRKSLYRQVVFKKAWAKRGTHTLRIVNIGNKRQFDIDGLGVVK